MDGNLIKLTDIGPPACDIVVCFNCFYFILLAYFSSVVMKFTLTIRFHVYALYFLCKTIRFSVKTNVINFVHAIMIFTRCYHIKL